MASKFFTQLGDRLKRRVSDIDINGSRTKGAAKKTDVPPRSQSSIRLSLPKPAPPPEEATTNFSDAIVPPRPQSSLELAPLESTPFRNEDAERVAPTIQPFGSSESALPPKEEKEDARGMDTSLPPRPGSSLGFTSPEPASSALQRRNSDGGATSEVPSIPGFHLSVTDVDVDEGDPVESSCYVVDPTAAYEIKSDLKSTLYSTAGLVIDVLKQSSDACTPLKSVVGALSTVLGYYDQTVANRKTIKSLIPRVQGLAESLSAPVPKGEIRERGRRVILRLKLEKVLQDLKPLEERGKVTRFLNNVSDAGTLAGMVEDIRDAMMEYQTALQQDIWYKNNELIDKVDLTLLKGMRHTAEAGFLTGGRQGCLRGTRRDVLLQIEKWLTDKTDHRVFWLSGLAGTGKSTIAQTFAEINFADGKLGASFFCSRDSEDRSNLRAIFPTLAFQLAHRYPLFRKQLLQVLRVNHDVERESLNSQLEKVIVRPLKETRISTLIIIDALDECKDEQPASALLSVLSRYVHDLPGVKFFITGRPEPRIADGFRLQSLCPITDVLKLHDVKRPSVDEDIRLYLRTRLTDVRNTRRECNFPEEWPNSWDIDRLCKEAAGLFIYASTVVKFVSSNLHIPKERLDEIILHSQTAAHEGDIDLLYTEILKLGFQGQNLRDKGLYSRFRSVVGAVLLVFQPLSTSALSDLVQNCETPGHILTTLRSLHSLLHVPDNEKDAIRALHKSFPDFLTDSQRCTDARFFVDPSVHHNDILSSCLELMEDKLKKNICGLDDYAVLSEVEDLSSRREECIGSSLEYACRYWTKHLAKVPCSGTHTEETLRAIDEFLTTRLLCWIEVLSITGHLGGAVYAINEIRQWQISAGAPASRQANDSERFILENFDVIHDSPSHIYHTALPLSPSSSWLRDCYKKEFAQEARILMGLPNKWDACSRTISIENQPSAFAYSGDIIAVGSESQTVVLLESITGSTTDILSGHEDTITSLSFSPDGTSLVSGSDDKSIKLWDRQTGGVIKTFSYTSAITSVSISLDGTTIASGAWDGTVCLWDIRAGTSRPSSMRHDYEVTAVSFSPTNSRRLLSSSVDKTVRQWDVGGRRTKAPEVYDEATAVVHVAYASDGTRFASCGGATATVRNSETGAVVATLSAPNQKIQFRCCCFSPDGRFVACAADTAIYVWDITDSEVRLVENLAGHSKRIISVVFSSSLISGSEDRSVKIWQGTTFLSDSKTAEDTPALLASAPIESVKLFIEANIVVTSDSSGLVRTWDLKTGKCKSSFSTQAEGMRDTHLAGDTLLVVWRKSGEYHIWDAGKERLLRTVHSSLSTLLDLKILGDGSKILGIDDRSIEARSIKTGEYAGHIRRKQNDVWEGPLVLDGSRVWLAGSKSVGWDFGGQEVSTFSLSREFPDRLRLNFIDRTTHHSTEPAFVQDATTKSQVFRLPGRYMTPGARRRWDGRYLVVCSPSGEVVIIDFDCICRK